MCLGVGVKVVRCEVLGSVRLVKRNAIVVVRVRVFLRHSGVLLLSNVRDRSREGRVCSSERGHCAAHVPAMACMRVHNIRPHVRDTVSLCVYREREVRFTRMRRSQARAGVGR